MTVPPHVFSYKFRFHSKTTCPFEKAPPSLSKPTLSSPSPRNKELSLVEKPMATSQVRRTCERLTRGDPPHQGRENVCLFRLVSISYDICQPYPLYSTSNLHGNPFIRGGYLEIWRWKYHGIAMAQKRPTDPKQSQIMANRNILS